MSKRPHRSLREDWQVRVFQTSVTNGPWTLVPGAMDRPQIELRAGESLLLDLGRSIDLAFRLEQDEIWPLPDGSFLDPQAGCFGWQPPTPSPGPVVLQFVSGASRFTTAIHVRRRAM